MKTITVSVGLFLWSSFLFSACQPLVETEVSTPTNTSIISVTSIAIIANTPRITTTATFTQEVNNCTTNDKLPDPDVPENYIGWRPGVDFAKLYTKENGNGNYMYWESLLNGYNDFATAGYKRSDNSYIFFVEKLVCRDDNNSRVYEVVDAVRTRKLSEDEDIAPLNFECYRFGKDGIEEQVFAIVNKTSGNAVLAWSMDAENKDIQETPLEGITCSPFGITVPNK